MIPPLVLTAWALILTGVVGPWTLLCTAPIVIAVTARAWVRWRNEHMPGVRGPRLFPQAIRERTLARFGYRCGYCALPIHYAADCPNRPAGCHDDYQADHALSWDDGGSTIEANCVAACRWCNQHKGAMSVDEFYAWLWSAEGRAAFAQRPQDRGALKIGVLPQDRGPQDRGGRWVT